MHYRHSFHAGNFADVFKHVLLIGLLQGLSRKEKPFLYLDTHAGAGLYDLSSGDAARADEWKEGVGRMATADSTPAWIEIYQGLMRQLAETFPEGRIYPGSPQIAQMCMRASDRMICCERIAEVAQVLKTNTPRAAVHQRDGYESHAFVPPAEKRGLVLIDPPFEARDEFLQCEKFLQKALKRWANGTYAVWYPLKQQHDPQRFLRRVARLNDSELLNCTFDNGARSQGQMHACGLLVINPPYGFDRQAGIELAWLAKALAQGPRPSWSVEPINKQGGSIR